MKNTTVSFRVTDYFEIKARLDCDKLHLLGGCGAGSNEMRVVGHFSFRSVGGTYQY